MGASGAAGCSVWATVVLIASGPAPFTELGLTYPLSLAMYAGLGAIGGILLGLLRPLTRFLSGAIGVGWLIAFVVYGTIITMYGHPPWRWDAFLAVLVALAALFVGGIGAIAEWRRHRRR